MNKTIEIRIQEKHNTLSKSERIVATAVLLHKRDLMQYSMDDLPHLTGVSKTTVARFLKLWVIAAIARHAMKTDFQTPGQRLH